MFYVLKFSKENCFTLLFTVLSYGQGALQKMVKTTYPHSISKEKSRNISNIAIQSHITKFSQKCFILSVYCTALCTERFEPSHSLSTSEKKIGHITNINIWSYNLKFSEKTVLYFHFTALCYVQGVRKKLKLSS